MSPDSCIEFYFYICFQVDHWVLDNQLVCSSLWETVFPTLKHFLVASNCIEFKL